MSSVDAVVIGGGPNGLAAAVTLARAGLSVSLYERSPTLGGGARTQELTLPGFLHDICSAVHPMALASEFFQRFGLADRIELITPEASYGHPLDGGRAGIAWHSLERTAEGLGRDGAAFSRLMKPLSSRADEVARFTGNTLLRVPRNPVTAARFGLRALEQGSPLWNLRFKEDVAPAMLSGVGAHSILPMPSLSTAAAALSLGAYAHGHGWAIPVGGSQSIINAMASDLLAHGGTIHTGVSVSSLAELPSHTVALFDTSAAAMKAIAPLPDGYARGFTYGNAAAKVDFALSGPVPWTNADLRTVGTVHVGGTRAAIAASEKQVAAGIHPSDPYVLVAQPSVFDAGRAPAGQQVLWAYTHVPAGSTVDPTEIITAQLERFAPGFRDLILASVSKSAAEMQDYNPNYIGGDIASGAATFGQLLARPRLSRDPWRTPAKGVYLASASATPGPGVHGLVGWRAAISALRNDFGIDGSSVILN